ncbi:MAG: PIG-L family deacetylase, partial [Candidatus Sungbacteria bacterium]|nr:PIG-L family deacetylase [Candidatus Sungbacteria bacterium]
MKHKKKTIVAIFAHPDDEAFGPAGTLAKLALAHDVYVICATKGEAGDKTYAEGRKLGAVR